MEALQIDTLAIHWSDALDAAENSLAEVSCNRRALRLSASELHHRLTGLRLERGAVELNLELLARTAHVELHHHIRGTANAGISALSP
ncbi:MAG TPA: hypothetical protein VF063_07150 [Gaiellaceae bacterium]